MAQLLKGAAVAAAMTEDLKLRAENLRTGGVVPTLAILRVGAREDDLAYERGAVKRCAAVGIEVRSVVLPESVTQPELLAAIESLNKNATVHGVLILRPLPGHLDDAAVRAALSPEKDVDGITQDSLAGVFSGSGVGFAPCTAQACMEILDYYGIGCAGKHAAVLGRSLVIGKPVSMLLLERNATVTVCHSRTERLAELTRDADIVITAMGRGELLGKEYFRAGQTVVDVSMCWSAEKEKFCGDVLFDEAEPLVSAITPVPGGVGAVTTAVLARHVVEAAEIILASYGE